MNKAEAQLKLNTAARAMAWHHFVHAYGHCSMRLNDTHFLVCAPKPMGLIAPGDAGTVVPINGDLPGDVLGEVRIHQQVYGLRNDVNAISRTMPEHIMALSALSISAKPRHGFGTYFWPEVPLWDDIQLIRTQAQAEGVAHCLGGGRAVAMRGNGLVTAGASIEEAVVWTWYANDMARVELAHLQSGLKRPPLTAAQCMQRATLNGRIIERMWDYLCSA